MRIKLKNFAWPILLFIVSFVIRIALFEFYLLKSPQSFLPYIDSYNYIDRAKGLLNYGIIGTQAYKDVYWTPLYSVILSSIYYLFSTSNIEVIIIQLILSAMCPALLYILMSKYISKNISLAVSLMLALDMPTISFANTIMSETVFVFILILFVLAITQFLEKGKIYLLVLSGLLAGTGVMTRPILFYFMPFSIIIFLFYYRHKIKNGLIYFLIFNSIAAIIIGPWVYRNVKLGYNGIAAVQDVNIYIFKSTWIKQRAATGQVPTSLDTDGGFARVEQILKERNIESTPFNRIKIYKELGRETLQEHPLLLLEYQAIYTAKVFTSLGVDRVFENISPDKRKPWLNAEIKIISYIYGIILISAYATFLIGLFSKKTWDKSCGILLVLFLFIYLTGLSGEWGGESRFRVPLMPLILIISGVGLEDAINFVKTLKFKRTGND